MKRPKPPIALGPGSVVVVTGGASGIGRALVAVCCARGADVVVLDDDEAGLEACRHDFPRVEGYRCDVGNYAAVRRAADALRSRFDRLDLLIVNAGIAASGDFGKTPLPVLRRVMDVNFWGAVHCCRAFVPELRSTAMGSGAAICFVLSALALSAVSGKAGYSASKHAAAALAEALAAELAGSGVSVTSVFPGATRTDLVARGFAVDPVRQEIEARHLAKGMSPDRVARRAIVAVERGRSRVVVGVDARLIDVLARHSPGMNRRLLRLYRRHAPFG